MHILFAVSALTISAFAQSAPQPTQVSASSIRFKQLKQAGWQNWPAIKELIELGEPEVLQTVITQLRLSDQEWVEDAVEALSLVAQPRLVGLLVNDVMSGQQGIADLEAVQPDPEADSENQPAPGPASRVIIAQLSQISIVKQEVKTWLASVSQLPGETKISQMRLFLEINRRFIAESKFERLKTPEAEAQQ